MAVLLVCGNLGLGGDWDGTRALLGKLAMLSAPNALLVGDTVDPTVTDGPRHLSYQRANETAGRHRGELRLRLRYGGNISAWWRQINLGSDDIRRVVKETGWQVVELIEDGVDRYVALRKD
jgi:hypothetical protein